MNIGHHAPSIQKVKIFVLLEKLEIWKWKQKHFYEGGTAMWCLYRRCPRASEGWIRQGMIRAGYGEGDNSNDADNGHDGDADTNDGIAHNWYIPRGNCAREDLRTHRIFTIDLAAKDLDDALHITPLPFF